MLRVIGNIAQLIEVFGPNRESEKSPIQFGKYVDVLYSLINTDPDKLLTALEGDINLDALYDSSGNSSGDSGSSGTVSRLWDKVTRFF